MKNSQLIETKELVKDYPVGNHFFRALNDINLQFKSGEFTGLVGPSGSGKTTLLNIIGALDSPSSGSTIVMDQKIEELTHREAAKLRNNYLGFIFTIHTSTADTMDELFYFNWMYMQ